MAINSLIEITDEFGKSFRMRVSTGCRNSTRGDWQAVDFGFIRFNSGYVKNSHSESSTLFKVLRHVSLFAEGYPTSALTLNDFETFLGVESGGTGFMFHDWARTVRAGHISWSRIG